MDNVNNILDYYFSFPSKSKKMKEFLIENGVEKLMTKKDKYFWMLGANKKYSVPSFILEKQVELVEKIEKNSVLSIIAPTSFGKTYVIINEIIKRKNIRIVISPTLSLCNEYFINIRSKGIKPSMSPNVEAEVYILTPEKFLTAKKMKLFENKEISFVVFDEFYEAFAGDRYTIFEEAYIYLRKNSKKIVQIIPHVKTSLPLEYKADDVFNATESATMRRITKYVKNNKKIKKYISTEFNRKKSNGYEVKNDLDDDKQIFEKIMISSLKKEKNIIILASKVDMHKKLEQISKMIEPDMSNKIIPIIKDHLLRTAQHTELAKYIENGVAYHNGTMDKFLRFLIETAFKNGEIKVLLGNSAITKGVNLSPDVLLILKYPVAPKAMNKYMDDIEILNAFGRTGRTMAGKTVGNVVIITSEYSKNKNKDFLIKGGIKEIILKKPEFDEIQKVDSFENAYKKYIVRKMDINITNEQKELLLKYMKPSAFDETSKEFAFDAVKSIFNIEFNEAWERNRRFLIRTYIMKRGYSSLIRSNRTKAIEWGYITNNGSPTKKETYFTKHKKEMKNIKFLINTFHEDKIVQYCYIQYENIAGFYFAQLLSNAIEKMAEIYPETKTYVDSYNQGKKADDELATKNGWPDSFVDVHISDKIGYSEKYLNNILKYIY